MFPTTDNPADRLLAILNEAKGKPDNHTVIRVFAEIFGFKPDDKVTFYRAIGYLNSLVDQVEFRVRQIPELKHDLYLRDIPSIRAVICPNAQNEGWSQYAQPLKVGAFTSLEFCSNELSKNHQEVAISNEQLDKLKKQVTELYQTVLASDLDVDLKAVLFDLITTIRISLDYYRIQGADGVKRALVYSAGLIKLHDQRFKGGGEKTSVKQVFAFVSDLVVLIKTAYKLKELGSGLGDLLKLQP